MYGGVVRCSGEVVTGRDAAITPNNRQDPQTPVSRGLDVGECRRGEGEEEETKERGCDGWWVLVGVRLAEESRLLCLLLLHLLPKGRTAGSAGM